METNSWASLLALMFGFFSVQNSVCQSQDCESVLGNGFVTFG